MPTKLQVMSALAADKTGKITRSISNWQSFLDSAAWLYKYPFHDQVLIHAQRPDARACAPIELWNDTFRRWVNRGAKGIALIDDSSSKPRLKYVFDVSDTNSRHNIPFRLWEMQERHEEQVLEELINRFGEIDEYAELPFQDQIMGIVHNAVSDNIPDYADELMYAVPGSALEGYDDFNIRTWFEELTELSVAYCVLTRLGFDAKEYFEPQDFSPVLDFNTPALTTQLGAVVGDISEQIIRQVERSVRSIEREERRTLANTEKVSQNEDGKNERSFEYGTDIQPERGLPDSRYTDGRAVEREHRQVRENEEAVPQGEPQRDIQPPAADGRADSASYRDRQDSERAGRADGERDGESRGLDGGTESDRSDEMDGADEQPDPLGGGADTSRADIQLTEEPTEEAESGELPAFTSGELILPMLANAYYTKGHKNEDIERFFRTNRDKAERTQFVKDAFDEAFCEVMVGDHRVGYKKEPVGLLVWDGAYLSRTAESLFSWDIIVSLIEDLIERDEFVTEDTQQSMLPTLEEQVEQIEQAEAENTPAFAVSQADLDNELCRGSGVSRGKLHIYTFYQSPHDRDSEIKFLKKEYGIGGHSHTFLDGSDGYESHDGKGLRFRRYRSNDEVTFSWRVVNSRIKELIALDRYLSDEEKAYLPTYEQEEMERRARAMEEVAAREALRAAAAAMDERRKDAKYHFSLGDSVQLGTQTYHILGYDDTTVMLSDPKFPLLSEDMPRDVFERRLRENPQNDKYIIEQEETARESEEAAPQYQVVVYHHIENGFDEKLEYATLEEAENVAQGYVDGTMELEGFAYDGAAVYDLQEKRYLSIFGEYPDEAAQEQIKAQDESPYIYAVGDVVYIDDTAFRITEIREPSVELLDPTLVYPVFRAENRDTFHHLLEQDERNARYMPDMPYWTITPNPAPQIGDAFTEQITAPVPESEQPELISQTVAFYPAEKNNLPFDVEIRTLRTAEPEKQEPAKTVPKLNFRITDDELGHGGAKTKFRMNMDAINTLQQIEFEGRMATAEEQEVLSRYVGWGGIPQAFDENNASWASEFAELYATLSPEEYEAARASTLNAHYTSPTVIKAIYQCIENMGFKTGNILEPACGVGNFFGLLPENMNGSKLYGVELDPITGRIARQLYQDANIAIQGFEDTALPDSFFDAAVGNVPFGNYGVADKRYDKNHFLIHDYFFAKTLDKVRPGGVIAFITSSGTMDKKNPSVRKYIAQRADLLGAIRLPNNAFLKNAGTEVVTDILFLQKRDRPTAIEPDWVHLGTSAEGFSINQYYVDNPDMVLGELAEESTQYGKQECTVRPVPGAELSEQLNDAIANIHGSITEYEREDEFAEVTDESIPADPSVRNFSYALHDGEIYYRENSLMNKVDVSATAESRIKGMIEIRDCTRRLIDYQLEGYPDDVISAEQQRLNTLYDRYTKSYGLLNSRANKLAFSDDSSYPLLCSLEELDEKGALKRKADMVTKRTIRQHVPVTSVDTASEALAVSIGEKACVDMEFMSSLTGKDEAQLYADLKGVIFLNPMYGYGSGKGDKYLTADEYLSGNVREKLEWAKRSAEQNPEDYTVNVEALEKVQPQDLTASEIEVRLGATWLPTDVVHQFMLYLLEPTFYARNKLKVHHSRQTEIWNIEGKNADYDNVAANVTYGTSRANAYKIIEDTLNLKDVRIFDKVETPDGKEMRVLNKKETILAQQKQQAIKEKFSEWIWADPDRRERLTKLYNEKFNSNRPREYDGSHIRFEGMNPAITLRTHQVNAIARTLYGGNTLLAHVVGAGKTFEMAASAMESKRLGLCQKSLFVVPNHLTEQWASEFLQLYPAANILVATRKDFEKSNRKKFCSRIATGDYDAVIIGHSQFEKIPVSAERQRWILEEQIDEITDGIREAKKERAEQFTIKQMEKMRKNLKVKLDRLNDQNRKDDVITFEELGVDRLYVDEAHFYKNLFLITKMRNVAGLAQTEAQKSSDLFMKCRYLDELTDGRGVVFATGTPISNSMTEMYTMQRYLQYSTLRRNDLTHFDAWASTFGETVTSIELAPEGTGYRAKTRFAKFYNLPELISMFKEVADIQTSDMLQLPVPEVEYKNIALKPSDHQRDIVESLAERAEAVRAGAVDPSVDNMLKITNDGRKLALDQRLVNGLLPDNEGGKVNACVENVYAIWEKHQDKKLTQLVFCDLSTPRAQAAKEDENEIPEEAFTDVYNDMKQKLILRGVPDYEIAFIHDASTEVQKAALFTKVRAGQVRILIGSTFKMGAGTNVQKKLVALHHLDIPWRPSDIEQREGRMIRQGNENAAVEVYRYVTENTFDAYMWQTIENKQKFISQIMTSKSPVRSCEDIDEQSLSYAEVKALATGNPYIKEKMDLDIQVSRLKLLKANYLSQKYALEDKLIKYFPKEIQYWEERIAKYEADLAHYEQHKSEDFPGMTLMGKEFAEKKDAGAELIAICKSMTSPEPKEIGSYKGFTLILSFSPIGRSFELTLKNELSHKIELGADIHGNIQRMDNALSNLAKGLEACKTSLAETKKQMENAKEESVKPFAQEAELAEKSERLAALDALLNMDKREPETLDTEPEQEEERERSRAEPDYER